MFWVERERKRAGRCTSRTSVEIKYNKSQRTEGDGTTKYVLWSIVTVETKYDRPVDTA